VGITAGSREVPGRKGLRQETSILYNNNNNKVKIIVIIISKGNTGLLFAQN